MKKTKEICEEVFTVVVPKEKEDHKSLHFKCLGLEDAYGRPSNAKQNIYNCWMRWAREVEGLWYFGIDSYNTFMFTFTGLYYDMKEDKYYKVHITPSKNELIELA